MERFHDNFLSKPNTGMERFRDSGMEWFHSIPFHPIQKTNTPLVQQNCPVIYQAEWFRFLPMGSSGVGSVCVCCDIVTITFWTHFKLSGLPPLHFNYWSFWRYPSVDEMILKTGHTNPGGVELIQWKIGGSLNLKYFVVIDQFRQQGFAATLTYHVLYSPWDPGIWAQAEATGREYGRAPAYYRIHSLDPAYYCGKICADPDYYTNVFLDQVHIGNDYCLVCAVDYLNIVKVCLDYNTHCDIGEAMKHQVPWDLGGSAWHWREVKLEIKDRFSNRASNDHIYYRGDYNRMKEVHGPWATNKPYFRYPPKVSAWGQAEFKGRGNVMTLVPASLLGLVSWAYHVGLGPTGRQGLQATKVHEEGIEKITDETTGSPLTLLCVPHLCLLLFPHPKFLSRSHPFSSLYLRSKHLYPVL